MFKFDKFTERANLALNYALEEAQSLGHTYVGSEHILFGLAKEGTGAAGTALAKFDVTPEAVEKLIQENVGVGLMTNLTFDDFTPRSKRVLQLAVMYAAQLGHGYVGTEHLLLALLDCLLYTSLFYYRIQHDKTPGRTVGRKALAKEKSKKICSSYKGKRMVRRF